MGFFMVKHLYYVYLEKRPAFVASLQVSKFLEATNWFHPQHEKGFFNRLLNRTISEVDLPAVLQSLIWKDYLFVGIYFLETHPFLRQAIRSIYGCKTSQAG